jgi:hypothetical protein
MFSPRTLKAGLKCGELAWEVMEQSSKYGEKPLRLVISKEAIRTVTSLVLTKAAEAIIEFWKVLSPQILKVSWCPELCVLSILYFQKDEPGVEKTKVFFVDLFIGNKIVRTYKKMKPVSVHLSPGKNKSISKLTLINDQNQTDPPISLSSSFIIKKGLKNEKFWRAMELAEDLLIREIFFGVSPVGIRILDPDTMEPELVIGILHLVKISYSVYYGSNMLKIRYLEDRSGRIGKQKRKKMLFYVLPVTAKDLMSWYDNCVQLGEIDLISEITKFTIPTRAPEEIRPKTSQLAGRRKFISTNSQPELPIVDLTPYLSQPLPHPSRPLSPLSQPIHLSHSQPLSHLSHPPPPIQSPPQPQQQGKQRGHRRPPNTNPKSMCRVSSSHVLQKSSPNQTSRSTSKVKTNKNTSKETQKPSQQATKYKSVKSKSVSDLKHRISTRSFGCSSFDSI